MSGQKNPTRGLSAKRVGTQTLSNLPCLGLFSDTDKDVDQAKLTLFGAFWRSEQGHTNHLYHRVEKPKSQEIRPRKTDFHPKPYSNSQALLCYIVR